MVQWFALSINNGTFESCINARYKMHLKISLVFDNKKANISSVIHLDTGGTVSNSRRAA